MKTEDQVVSLELAKELKELGVKQDSLWFWTWAEWNEEVEWVLISQDEAAKLRKEKFSAHTVAELGEKLPLFFSSYHTEYDGWQCDSPWGFNDRYMTDEQKYHVNKLVYLAHPRRLVQEAKTEADVRAKMLIYLIKEGIIKAEELK